MKQFKIPVWRVRELTDKIQLLNYKCSKLRCPEIQLNWLGFEYMNCTMPDGSIKEYKVRVCTIDGQAPVLNGWKFLAVFKYGGLYKQVYGDITNIPPNYLNGTEPVCEHCHTTRRRSKTVVVQHEDGRILQVGTDCLKDFLGHANPEELASLTETIFNTESYSEYEDISEFRNGGLSNYAVYPLLPFLAHSVRLVEQQGYVKRNGGHNGSSAVGATSELAWGFMQSKLPVGGDELVKAQAIIDWAVTLTTETDYKFNINQIAKSGKVSYHDVGMACSMVPTHQSHLDELMMQGKNSQWVGSLKERLTLDVAVVSSRQVSAASMYSEEPRWVYNLVDATDNVFVWWRDDAVIKVGARLRIKGTVKQHGEFKGIKHTVLNRVKII